VYGGLDLRCGIRARGSGYVMAVRSKGPQPIRRSGAEELIPPGDFTTVGDGGRRDRTRMTSLEGSGYGRAERR
jgi:hypothetical protein